jgi:hypothetical protein
VRGITLFSVSLELAATVALVVPRATLPLPMTFANPLLETHMATLVLLRQPSRQALTLHSNSQNRIMSLSFHQSESCKILLTIQYSSRFPRSSLPCLE